LSWYVIRTKTGVEGRVEKALSDDGYAVFLPQYKKIVRHKRYKYRIPKWNPLFPGYMFIHIHDDHDRNAWMDVVKKRYVSGFLGATHPVPISSEIVSDIWTNQSEGNFGISTGVLNVGDSVEVDLMGRRIRATVDRVTLDTIQAVANWMGKAVTIERPLPQAV